MKYFEFGQENEKTLVLLHGVYITWKMLYTNVSKATMYNMEYFMFGYRYKYEAFNLSDTYLLHGEKEPGLKKVLKLPRDKYHFQHKVFLGLGHGSLLLEPERLLEEVNLAYKEYK